MSEAVRQSGASQRAQAFLLFIDLPKAGPFIEALAGRGLRPLLVVPSAHSTLEQAAMSFVGCYGHPFEGIAAINSLEPENAAEIFATVDRWRAEYDIRGVLATCEALTEVAGIVTDFLDLPGVGLRAARACRSKLLQRLYLSDWSPRSVPVSPKREDAVLAASRLGYPLVIKPTNLYCSVGVQAIRDESELVSYLDSHPGRDLLVEEQVKGREYSVETLSVGGKEIFSSITQKLTNEGAGRYFVEMGHSVPAPDLTEEQEAQLLSVQQDILARLAFDTGMAHAEYRLTGTGRLVLMEIGARPPGGGLLQLYNLAAGVSMEALLIDVALGDVVEPPAISRCARQIYLEHPEGPLASVQSDLPEGPPVTWAHQDGLWPTLRPSGRAAPPTVHQVLVLKREGDELSAVTSSFDRTVSVIFDGPAGSSLDEIEAIVRRSVRVSRRSVRVTN